MSIRYLNGIRLKNVVLAGAKRVIEAKQNLNAMNVFPVPDGDTGSNMASTFNAILEAIQTTKRRTLSDIGHILADAALNGSRGNSGAILAQFFEGLAVGLNKQLRASTEQFALAIETASQYARDAILNPVEGTMISVMHSWSQWIKANHKIFDNFERLFQQSLIVAEAALAETPKQLNVLAQAQVVDAGAQGFVFFLQGIAEEISHSKPLLGLKFSQLKLKLEEFTHKISNYYRPEHKSTDLELTNHTQHHDIEFQYCTECIISGKNLDLNKIKDEMRQWGNSLVVAGNSEKVKIHIHTNDARRVFRTISHFGSLLETKFEDMWAQYRQNAGIDAARSIALVMDTSFCLPHQFAVEHNVIFIPMQIIINEHTYWERANINRDQFLKSLANKHNDISTAQPTIVDCGYALEKAAERCDTVFAMTVSAAASGTFQVVTNAASKCTEANIEVYDTENIGGGSGLLALVAAEAIQQGCDVTEIKRRLHYSKVHMRAYFTPVTIKYLIKGGRLSKWKGHFLNVLRLIPIFSAGKTITKKAVAFGYRLARSKLVKLVHNEIAALQQVRMLINYGDNKDKKIAEALAVTFKKQGVKNVLVAPAPSVVLAHTGPRGIGIAFVGFTTAESAF